MNGAAWLQLGVYLALLLTIAWPLSAWIQRVTDGDFALGRRVEAPLYRLAGVDATAEQGWLRYALGLLLFNGLGLLTAYALQRLQAVLPLNPQGMAAITPDSAFNTAVSFVTNTNWQSYAGESTMSHLTQMAGLGVQNFVSAAVGFGVIVAIIRRKSPHRGQARASKPHTRRSRVAQSMRWPRRSARAPPRSSARPGSRCRRRCAARSRSADWW